MLYMKGILLEIAVILTIFLILAFFLLKRLKENKSNNFLKIIAILYLQVFYGIFLQVPFSRNWQIYVLFLIIYIAISKPKINQLTASFARKNKVIQELSDKIVEFFED